MDTGELTPRSNDIVVGMRFVGGFGQSSGFSSILEARVNRAGEAYLGLTYQSGLDPDCHQFLAVMLTNEQRKTLGQLMLSYDPVLFEPIT